MNLDSFRFLPRSFRPFYEGRGPFPGEDAPVWAPFGKRLSDARIALLSSAGLYPDGKQTSYDLDHEQTHPDWGDPSWRAIPASAAAGDIAVAHLHINDEDLRADPEIALPSHMLAQLVSEGIVGGATAEHLSVMGYQDRSLQGWRDSTLPALVAKLRAQDADGLILAPA